MNRQFVLALAGAASILASGRAAAQTAADKVFEQGASLFDFQRDFTPVPTPPAAAPAAKALVVGGTSIEPLVDGDAFVAATLETLRGAHETIDLEMFDFYNEELIDALCAKARAPGMTVRVVLDPFMGHSRAEIRHKREMISRIKTAGALVAFYPTRSLRGAIYKIDHVKLLVADGRRVIVGGSNWGEDPEENHDYNLRIEGRAVARLSDVFAEAWALANGRTPPPHTPPSYDPADGLQVLITDREHREPLEAILAQIRRARVSIRTEQLLLDQPDVVDALIAAAKRGVKVQVLLDPNTFFFGGVNAETEQRLMREGVPARTFKDPAGRQTLLHAKMAVFDGETVIMGSANWSRNALQVNHELALLFRDAGIAGEFSAVFDSDWAGRSRPAEAVHGARRLLQRLTSAIAGLFS